MRTYLSVFRMRLLQGMQYRSAALAGICAQFFWGAIRIMIFIAFYRSSSAAQPMSIQQLVTYVWLQQSFLYAFMLWYRDNSLFQLITSGNIAYELCRPVHLYSLWFAKLIAGRMAGVALRCVPLILITFFLPAPYSLTLPHEPLTLVLFIVSMFLGVFVVVGVSMFMYMSVFITMSPVGSSLLFNAVGEFFAGLVIPLPLLPQWVQRIAYMLPYHLTCDMPIRIYTGHIPVKEALMGMGIQLLWIGGLVALGTFTMERIMHKIRVQGG